MAFPYALIDSLLHFGKVIPSNSWGSPSSPPQTAGTVGKFSHVFVLLFAKLTFVLCRFHSFSSCLRSLSVSGAFRFLLGREVALKTPCLLCSASCRSRCIACGTSWNNKRLDGVPKSFQVSATRFEYQSVRPRT